MREPERPKIPIRKIATTGMVQLYPSELLSSEGVPAPACRSVRTMVAMESVGDVNIYSAQTSLASTFAQEIK